MTRPVALVGIGHIARAQHIPAIAANPGFILTATVSRQGSVPGVPAFRDLDAFLAGGPDAAVALCVPAPVRTAMALAALAAGRDVLLEKPPAATVGEVEALVEAAVTGGRVLFATWHSRFAGAVPAARAWLGGRRVASVRIDWKEDVRRWHPGQSWIWQPAGFGVFDPGINALSILTEILPGPFLVRAATLLVPANRETPIAASVALSGPDNLPVTVELDWRHAGADVWTIAVETDAGRLELCDGGARMVIDGVAHDTGPNDEYPAIYRHFAGLLDRRESDVDARPLRICADVFLVGRRVAVEPFDD